MTEITAKVVLQEPTIDGVITTYSNGDVQLIPYSFDENGDKYVELFPKDAVVN